MTRKVTNNAYSQELKDEVALRALTGEAKTYELMKEYGISRESVAHWKQEYRDRHPDQTLEDYAKALPLKHAEAPKEKLCLPRLKELRVSLGYSQKEIGEVLGIQQDAYAKYETGMVELPVWRLLVLSRFYHVTTDYLLNLSDDMTAEGNDNHEL